MNSEIPFFLSQMGCLTLSLLYRSLTYDGLIEIDEHFNDIELVSSLA